MGVNASALAGLSPTSSAVVSNFIESFAKPNILQPMAKSRNVETLDQHAPLNPKPLDRVLDRLLLLSGRKRWCAAPRHGDTFFLRGFPDGLGIKA